MTLTSALIYLEVWLQHAIPAATMLCLQTSLGTALLVHMLGTGSPSLFLVCGPGLVVGGALTFAVFNYSDRESEFSRPQQARD